ncbi:MAG: metal ABC transporter substrate-binding protein [Ruminiclostridium sp.]|nr:metal ABC transporter substrate-binding protein [Ruminiclostridium sp.]
MKRPIILLLAFFMLISVMSACSSAKVTRSNSNGKILVYTSFYTMYDFTLKIAGDKAVIKNMVPAGTEPHDWEPSPKDIAGLYDADLFIYNGCGMESWVPKVLESIKNSELITIETSNYIESERILGSEQEHEHSDEYSNYDEHKQTDSSQVDEEQQGSEDNLYQNDNHDNTNEHVKTDEHDQTVENSQIIKDDHDHIEDETHSCGSDGYDPHVWLNPLNAKKQMEAIKDGLVKVDPSNSRFYQDNYDFYAKKLDDLDKAYKEAVNEFARKEIVVSHEAFGYLCNAYGLTQIAIEGISSESEPTPAKMAQIINFVKENDVKVIFFEELASPKVAEAIARETGAKTDLLNPLEGLSEENSKAGKDYFSVMEENLEALKRALLQ